MKARWFTLALTWTLTLSVTDPLPAHAQAEPAPPGSVPGAAPPPPPQRRDVPRVRVAASIHLAGLLGESAQVAPPLGFGFGLQLSASLLPLGPLRLGFTLDFAQERFSRSFAPEFPNASQLLVHNTFAALALLDVPTRWVRPYLVLGPGLSQANHQRPQIVPEDAGLPNPDIGIMPLVRVGGGLGISPLRWFEFGFGADLSFTFSDQRGGVTVQNGNLSPAMGKIFAPGFWAATTFVAYRFY